MNSNKLTPELHEGAAVLTCCLVPRATAREDGRTAGIGPNTVPNGQSHLCLCHCACVQAKQPLPGVPAYTGMSLCVIAWSGNGIMVLRESVGRGQPSCRHFCCELMTAHGSFLQLTAGGKREPFPGNQPVRAKHCVSWEAWTDTLHCWCGPRAPQLHNSESFLSFPPAVKQLLISQTSHSFPKHQLKFAPLKFGH